MRKTVRIAGILLAASCSAIPAMAQAQTAPAGAEGAVTSSDDIIVTARRREERLQDVPQAIIAFNSQQLTRANINEVTDLVRVAPGLVYQPNALGNKSISLTLRAQRQNLPNMTFDPSVVVYFNEIPNMRMLGAATSLYDLSSIQVLKGPQGTLFGRNSTGGSILVTPQAPTSEFGGYVKAGAGNYGMWEAEGAVNVPLGNRAALRLSGRHTQHDGYMPVVGKGYSVDDDDTDAYRVSLRVEPVDGLVNTTVFDGLRQVGSGTAFRVVGVLGTCLSTTTTGMCGELNALTGQPWNATTSNVDRNGTNIKAWQISNITTADVGGITLKNIFGYRKLSSYVTFDIDGSNLNVLNGTDRIKMHQVSNEVQLIGKAFGDHLTYQLGGFLFEEDGDELQFTPTVGTTSVSDFSVTNKSYSIYGQATLKVPGLERLSLTAGLRQTWDNREMVNRGKTIFGVYTGYDLSQTGSLVVACRIQVGAQTSQGVINPCEKTVKADFSKLTYNFSADYKINDDVLVYAATRKGYRAGGLFNAGRAPAEFLPYRPELLTDYEIGLKASYSLGAMRGRTNLAVYTGNFKDAQRNTSAQEVITDPATQQVITINRNIIFNVDSARVRGFELEQMLRPFEALELNVAYAYTDAKYNRFVVQTAAGTVDYTKSPFAGAPAHTISASARLQLPVPESAGRMFAQVSGTWISSTYTADGNPMFNGTANTDAADGTPPFSLRSRALIDGYHTFDARLDWEKVAGTNLDLAVWVRNFTNEHYYTGGQYVEGLGFSVRNPGTPRTFGVQARYDF